MHSTHTRQSQENKTKAYKDATRVTTFFSRNYKFQAISVPWTLIKISSFFPFRPNKFINTWYFVRQRFILLTRSFSSCFAIITCPLTTFSHFILVFMCVYYIYILRCDFNVFLCCALSWTRVGKINYSCVCCLFELVFFLLLLLHVLCQLSVGLVFFYLFHKLLFFCEYESAEKKVVCTMNSWNCVYDSGVFALELGQQQHIKYVRYQQDHHIEWLS